LCAVHEGANCPKKPLKKHRRFLQYAVLPVPIIITEPAVGTDLGVNMGPDLAKGPEEEVIYISFGTRWQQPPPPAEAGLC